MEAQNTEAQSQEQSTGLPSDIQQANDNQALNDWNALVAKEPEYMKQFKSLDDFKNKYKELHNQYSNTVREYKEKEKSSKAEQESQAQVQQKMQEQQETIMSMLPQFIENGMKLTPEMEQMAKEKDIDIRDLKLGAIDLRERIEKAHSVVGGSDEYNAMIAWAKENTNEEQRNAFDKDVVSSMSEFAIRGMYSMYKEATKDGQNQVKDRIRGETASSTIKPYGSQDEILAHRRYINSARGRADSDSIAKHKQRMAITPDAVIFGR